jgi:hypothetical protein
MVVSAVIAQLVGECAAGWMTGVLGIGFRQGLGVFVFAIAFVPALGPAQHPVGTSGFFPGVELPGREADHSPPSNAGVGTAWSYTSASPVRLHDVVPS